MGFVDLLPRAESVGGVEKRDFGIVFEGLHRIAKFEIFIIFQIFLSFDRGYAAGVVNTMNSGFVIIKLI
jgi:hypothetical protein